MLQNFSTKFFGSGAVSACLLIGTAACAGTAASARDHDDRLKVWRGFEGGSTEDPVAALSATGVLHRSDFVKAVLARNPNLEAARQGWRAALAAYPQEQALSDPTLEYSIAPFSIGSDVASFGQSVTLQQMIPWPGKLGLAGKIALAESDMAQGEFETMRLHLGAMASMLFDQYYAVARSLELNEQHTTLVTNIKQAATAQYEAGRGSQQDPLQADVELAHVEHRQIVLLARRSIAIAQMNGLLHEAPETPLPPPPAEHDLPLLDLPGVDAENGHDLQADALASRPELRAHRAQLRGRESARQLADRAYYPDLGVMASYNSMWTHMEHQWMVGVSLNIPLQLAARQGAVDKADAQMQKAKAEIAGVSDDIRVQVERARLNLTEAQHLVHLFRERLLPASRAQIQAAQAGYVAGQVAFQALIDAERSLRNVELEHEEALAGFGERYAELLRAIGKIPGMPTEAVASAGGAR